MRVLGLVLLVVAAAAYDASKFAALVQTGTRANDAVESVYNLLRDLKTENVNGQVAADAKNNTDEEIIAKVISELTAVANINKKNFENAKAFRESIEKQITENVNWVAWAEGRIAEVARRTEALNDQRCYSNGLFVRSLKDHSDAINVVTLLRQDLSGYLTGQPSSLAQIKVESIADKLSMYSHLFNQDAMKSFAQLTAAQQHPGDNLGEQVYNLLGEIEQVLNQTLVDLEKYEIESAFALARWISDTGAEVSHLTQEIERKNAQLEKLNLQHPASIASQAKQNTTWKESVDAINGAVADLEEKREAYQQGNERRAEENAIIDICIQIFKDQVRNLVSETSLKH